MHWNDENEVQATSIVSQIEKDVIDRDKHFVLPVEGIAAKAGGPIKP